MTAFQMLDEVAAVTAERDRARDLAAKLEARLELAERVVEAGRVAVRPIRGRRWEQALRDALAAYDEASR